MAARAAGSLAACANGPCASPSIVDYRWSSAETFVAVANFGLLTGGPGAPGWQLICDDVYLKARPELVRVDARGRIFAPATRGLQVSDDGCSWQLAQGDLAGMAVIDIAFERGSAERVWALAGADAARALALSTDGGTTFNVVHRFGDGHPYQRLLVAPSDGQRIYAAGGAPGASTWLASSADGGATFSTRDLAQVVEPDRSSAFALLAASPDDPQVLFFSLVDAYGDEIWRSADGGRSLQRVLKGSARDWMTALAFGASAETVYAAAAVVPVLDNEPPGRLYVSRDGGRTFADAIPAGPDGPAYRCLQFTAGKLYACAGEDASGQSFLVGVSTDEGASWSPLLRLGDLDGVKSCVRSQCVASEAWLCDSYGRCPSAPGMDAGGSGEAVDAGGADTRGVDAAGACAEARCGRGGGCDCGIGGTRPGAIGVVVVAAVVVRLRRRRRS